MENLPCDLLTEIFVRLRAKQVGRMRCVSKPLYALLSQPDFIKTHLNHSTRHNHFNEIVLVFDRRYTDRPFTTHPLKSPNIQVNDFIKLPANFPFPADPYTLHRSCVLGAVNGLICIYTAVHGDGVIHVWNPSLSAIMMSTPLKPPMECPKLCRFGYDPKTDDYKVVGLSYHGWLMHIVWVYSLRKNSWKSFYEKLPVNQIDFDISTLNEVCVNDHDGHVHWLYSYVGDQRYRFLGIMAFDLGAETFSQISLPDSVSKLGDEPRSLYNERFDIALGSWAGKLCVTSRTRHGEFEMWVMNEYGVAESWVKHHNLSSQLSGININPIGFTLNKKFLYGVESHLPAVSSEICDQTMDVALYDPDTTKVAHFSIHLQGNAFTKVVPYIDSLVWIAPPRKYGSMGCRKDVKLLKGSILVSN
uniref:F-box/kelch-repeat protein At3g06240-like n=1 Tax=Erigeron canadensis TaxID=72917 RepID=UPI001CB92049|nr:F-box/kelch-repeat protein At3g06240-like [Erigeron canadensis]